MAKTGKGTGGKAERRMKRKEYEGELRELPAAGEVVIFDRSWYNRAGVERVMGFCTEEQTKRYLLSQVQYESLAPKKVKFPARQEPGDYTEPDLSSRIIPTPF
jgi:Polyphosphate kinase 2 (PPK2)